MRATLLIVLLIAGSAVAFLPSATATGPCPDPDHGQPCTPPPYTLPMPDCRKVPDKPPLVEVTYDCKAIVILDLFSCPFGEQRVTTTYGPLTVHRDQCTSCPAGAPCPPPAESTMMADPFPTCVTDPCGPSLPGVPDEACPVRDLTPGVLLHPLWGWDCTLDVHTACTGGASGSYDARVGFIDVSLAKCSDGPAWS